ncbi:MAG: adenosine deaminase [Gammaproteobacteria bacterium]
MKNSIIFFMTAWLLNATGFAQTIQENHTERFFASIHNNAAGLEAFLTAMPKGGDLHNHESGATFAKNALRYAYQDHLCVDRNTFVVSQNPNCAADNLLNTAINDSNFYNSLIDAWTMRHFVAGKESGHDHFFATFGKIGAITSAHRGDILAEIMKRASTENELYLELMVTIDGNASGRLGKQLGWDADSNFNRMREKLLASEDFNKIIIDSSKNLDADDAKKESILNCKINSANTGCDVTIRYLYQVLREQPPENVFAQMLLGFELAHKDPRVVGINMVQPEDGTISMRDYKLQMQMLGYLHQLYPDVHVSLHAGELNDALVPAEGLTFHIHDAVETAHANRIGHGVDLIHEDNVESLLKTMADNHILVEINLSSNQDILNIFGKSHPLPIYLSHGVPVALSTDDEGVSRENLVVQYLKAAREFNFDYLTLKMLARNSISYAFLRGENLWQDHEYRKTVLPCVTDSLGSDTVSASCRAFLTSNEKAKMQWELEKRFVRFEQGF